MKLYVICGVFCAVTFFAMGMQLGLFGNQRKLTSYFPAVAQEKKKPQPRAKFPQELAPAAQAQAVPIAAEFKPGDQPHKLVFLKPSGALHAWHDSHSGYHEDWFTDRVEETELVVVVGNSRKIQLSYHTYPNGAPPITRYQYELEASIVEAKSGRVIANRLFQNVPRTIRPVEAWELTVIGAPVSYQTVYRWAAGIAKYGAPAQPTSAPLVINVD